MSAPLLERLRRRRLWQWALAYLAGAWVFLQVLGFLRDEFNWTYPIVRAATVFVAIAFLAVLVVAWYHGERGRQRITAVEGFLLGLILLSATAAAAIMTRDEGAALTRQDADDRSIAVLPFDNLSTSQENEYFSDGIMEDVLTNLAKSGSLRVISRTSVMQYKGTDKTVPQIARELGVAHVLEGSVRREGNKVRINAQLISASDAHLWAQTYDRDLTDVFAVQAEIARAIADQLSFKLTTAEQSHVDAGRTDNVAAYDLYLRGRELLISVNDSMQNNRARSFFRRALELDPKYAAAEAALSRVYLFSGQRDSAFAAARRAIALAPDLADGYASLAGAYRVFGQFREALIEARKAVDRNPNNARAIYEIGYMTGELGAHDEALPWLKRAVALEPTATNAYNVLGTSYRQMGAAAEAARWYRRALEVDPSARDGYFGNRARVALSQNNLTEARLWSDSIDQPSGKRLLNWRFGNLRPMAEWLAADSAPRHNAYAPHWAYILQQRGERAEAERFINIAEKLAHDRIAQGDQVQAPSRLLTLVHALRGDRAKTLTALRTWIDHGLRDEWEITYEPILSFLYKDPEFLRVIDDLKKHQAQMLARAKREGWY